MFHLARCHGHNTNECHVKSVTVKYFNIQHINISTFNISTFNFQTSTFDTITFQLLNISTFKHFRWLASDEDDGQIIREIPVGDTATLLKSEFSFSFKFYVLHQNYIYVSTINGLNVLFRISQGK